MYSLLREWLSTDVDGDAQAAYGNKFLEYLPG